MKKCRKCGTSLREDEKRCTWCGTKVRRCHKKIWGVICLISVVCIITYIFLPKKLLIGLEDGNLRIKTKTITPTLIEKKDYDIEFTNYEIIDDKVIITYSFTNNTDESTGEFLNIIIRAFQDGLEIDEVYDTDLVEDTFLKNIQSGATVELKKVFKLRNTESAIALEAKKLAGDLIAKKEFEIGQKTKQSYGNNEEV